MKGDIQATMTQTEMFGKDDATPLRNIVSEAAEESERHYAAGYVE